MKTLTAVCPGFGSKRLIAPQIVPHFGPHTTFYDLFCFSCAILFAKQPCRQEVASEKNPDVVNLLRCLADPALACQLWEWSRSMPLTESMFDESAIFLRLTCPPTTNVLRACDFLLTSWQGPSGLAGTTAKPRFAKRNTASGGSTAARWRSVAESIPAWHERLRNVEFRNADALELIGDVPDREGVVVYADPPYLPDSRRGGTYKFDMTIDQHAVLAAKLSDFRKTRVVVSLYETTQADVLYLHDTNWRKVRLDAPRKMGNTVGGESPPEQSGEVVYVNDIE